MTQLEIEIKVLEGQLDVINQTISNLNGIVPDSIKQQKLSLENELAQKRLQLNAQNKETIYEHLSRIVGYSNDLKDCIEDTVDKLLVTNISNASDPGLLLGKIQCGKTRAFVGVMGLAFDRGIDVCVVLTKSDDGLVEQTTARMEYEFRDYLSTVNMHQTVIGVHKTDRGMHFSPAQINNQKNIFVTYKNTTRLKYLIELFNKTEFKNKRVLIIDDEADFVSRAFYQKNNDIDAGKIALLIDEFAQIPDFCRYLQVTATPYSLFLQPDHTVQVNNGSVEPFRPRFVTLVPIHENYIGGKHYFIKSQNSSSMYSYLKHIVKEECMERLLDKNKHAKVYKNAQSTPVYEDLRKALMSYFVASAIRQLQEETLKQQRYNSSFFMHISTATKDHRFEKLVVDNILSAWTNEVTANKGQGLLADFDIAYTDMQASNSAGNQLGEISIFMPSSQDVWNRFLKIFEDGAYLVQIVNSETKGDLLGKDGQLKLKSPLNIFIGGFKLDRGITIDHMLGFMYGRNPQVKQTDAVLQHHRMYGNRSKEDMAVTRLHTTQRLYDIMEWIENIDHQLRETFIKAMKNPGAPMPMVAIQFDRQLGIKPCGTNKLLISDLESFDSFKRFTPSGFQTASPTKIKPIIDGIDNLLKNENGYNIGTPFLIKKDHVYQIIKNIRSTFIYDRPIDNNAGLEWDEDVMIAAIEKYAPQDGMIWCYVKTNLNMSRVRQNDNFVDAPEDGNTDTPIAQRYTLAQPSRPFLMLFRENGLENIVNGVNKGWRNAPFYWPSLRLPQNIDSCVYCK
jgi:hypothetical protein